MYNGGQLYIANVFVYKLLSLYNRFAAVYVKQNKNGPTSLWLQLQNGDSQQFMEWTLFFGIKFKFIMIFFVFNYFI